MVAFCGGLSILYLLVNFSGKHEEYSKRSVLRRAFIYLGYALCVLVILALAVSL
ncbi:MAG: hypothetical protein U0641_05785 [Anaerolineae bacterium]